MYVNLIRTSLKARNTTKMVPFLPNHLEENPKSLPILNISQELKNYDKDLPRPKL